MINITISNIKTKGVKPLDFYKNPKFINFPVSGSSRALEFLKNLFLKTILKKTEQENIIDYSLSREQTKQLMEILSAEIDKLLPLRENKDLMANVLINWKGKKYKIRAHPFYAKNMEIYNYYKIYQIANECLNENIPLFVSINQK